MTSCRACRSLRS